MTQKFVPGSILKRNHVSIQDLYMNVYSIFHSTQIMETTQMSVGEWYNKVWYIHTVE